MNILSPKVRNSTGQSIYIEVNDAASPFLPKTGLAFNTAGIAMSYQRTRGARVGITPVDLASPTAAWTSGGIKEVDATNMPGVYRVDLPDLALADDGAISDGISFTIKATNYAPTTVLIPLIGVPIVRNMGVTVRTNS